MQWIKNLRLERASRTVTISQAALVRTLIMTTQSSVATVPRKRRKGEENLLSASSEIKTIATSTR